MWKGDEGEISAIIFGTVLQTARPNRSLKVAGHCWNSWIKQYIIAQELVASKSVFDACYSNLRGLVGWCNGLQRVAMTSTGGTLFIGYEAIAIKNVLIPMHHNGR